MKPEPSAPAGAGRRDTAIGRWCAPRLDGLGDRTIMVGLGTVVMGFAAHFAALANVAIGDFGAARVRFERAITLAHECGAALWEAHSTIELAAVLTRSDAAADRTAARQSIAALRGSPIVARSARLARRVGEVAGTAADRG